MLLFGVLYCVQVLVNLRLGLTHLGKRTTTGRSPAPYFLSALLVLIIGFGTCNFVVNSNLDRMD